MTSATSPDFQVPQEQDETASVLAEIQQHRAPHPVLAATELGRTVGDMARLAVLRPLLRAAPHGDGHSVMVLPGFMADDSSTRQLRRFLSKKGYDVHAWGLGRNLGPNNVYDMERRLLLRLHLMKQRRGRKVSIVGWSLGGIIARELARAEPDLVRQVITLGSPFGGHPAATNVWRIFQMITKQTEMDPDFAEQLQQMSAPVGHVPSTAIYSKTDGVASWRVCMEQEHAMTDNIEVRAAHCGLGFNPFVFYAIADRLSEPEGSWRPFNRDAPAWRRRFYPSAGH